MSLQFFSDRRKPNKKTRQKRHSASKWLIKWMRNFTFIFIGITLVATLTLRWVNPPYTSFMVAQRLATDFVPYKINWVSLQNISPNLLIAAVAAEDQKFPHHYGFDLKAIQSALKENKKNKTLRGASTITQQVAKNIFLWPKKSIFRKGLEAYFALLIETLWPKWRILEVYLNVAEFGPNIFGVKNAAYTHFKKSANQLTRDEANILAAVLPNPHKMHASKPSHYVRQRATDISNQVESLGGPAYLKSIWE